MRKAPPGIVLLLVVSAVVGLSSCSSKPPAKGAGDAAPAPVAVSPAPVAPVQVVPDDKAFAPSGDKVVSSDIGAGKSTADAVKLADVFFDFDLASIRPDQQEAIRANAAKLDRNPQLQVLIEGHCDERGTKKYNMALGERRASAAKDALTILGVDSSRISITSFGSEAPFAPGHDESAWAQNRRAHFVAKK